MDEKQEMQKQEQGLHLTDIVVKQISGPVSMDYYVPIRSLFMRREIVSVPLIMLWGDVHQDDSGLCAPCSAEEGCYPIYDKAFLKELDKLAELYPIDFYTEYSKDFEYHQNEKDILFGRFLKQTTASCHVKALRSKREYEAQCPTKCIRWHYADPRFMKNTMERYLFNPIVLTFNKQGNMYEKMEEWRAADPEQAGGLDALAERLREIRQEIHHLNTHSTTNEEANFKQDIQDLQYELVHHILMPLKGELMKDDVPNIKYRMLFNAYTDYLAADGKGRKSVLFKQFIKIGIHPAYYFGDFITSAFVNSADVDASGKPFLMELETSIKALSPDVTAFIRLFFKKGPEFDNKERRLYENIRAKHGDSSVGWIWYGLAYVHEYLFSMMTLLVDTYTLLRMMKPPQGSCPPYLALGFFGATHTHNMSRILATPELFQYTRKFHTEGDDLERCITISKNIPLARDLEVHAATIHKQNVAVRRHRNYINIISREEATRRQNNGNGNGKGKGNNGNGNGKGNNGKGNNGNKQNRTRKNNRNSNGKKKTG